jgi:hypothetical protein
MQGYSYFFAYQFKENYFKAIQNFITKVGSSEMKLSTIFWMITTWGQHAVLY